MLNVVSEFGKKNDVPFDYMLEDDTLLTASHKVGGNKYCFSYDDGNNVVFEWYVPIVVKFNDKRTVVGFNKIYDISIKGNEMSSYVPKELSDFVYSIINKSFPIDKNMTIWNGEGITIEELYFHNKFSGWNVRYKNYYINIHVNTNHICIVDGVKQIINVHY